MAGGFMGKILWVNLSDDSQQEEEIKEEVYQKFLGGYGLAVRVISEHQSPKVDPLGPENILAFTVGPLTGTPAYFSGRFMVSAKSPATGGWGDANCGGTFGPEIKRCGYDGIFIKGSAENPVYIFVNNGQVEIRDARHLWGKDAVETETLLQQELGKVKIATIGQPGEKRSFISGIVHDRGRIAARMGLGAVAGAKNLKAVVLKGNKKVPVADRDELIRINKSFSQKYMSKLLSFIVKDPFKLKWGRFAHLLGKFSRIFLLTARGPGLAFRLILKRYGTAGFAGWSFESGDTPIKNWKGVAELDFPGERSHKISDEELLKYKVKRYGCANCPLACGGILEVKDGPYPLKETHLPEYETVAAFGNLSLNDDLNVILKINDLCNRAGIDTISLGNACAFAIECFEEGLLGKEDTDGLELKWGDAEVLLKLVEKTIKREGIGDILADGVKRAAEKIGKGAEQFAIHSGGIELAMHDPRSDPGYGISYQCDPTPGKHLSSFVFQEMMELEKKFDEYKPSRFLYLKSSRYRDPEEKGKNQAIGQKYFHLLSATGLCLFSALTAGGNLPIFEWLKAATNWDFSPEEYLEIGERIMTLKQLFNCREGLTPIDFQLSARAYGVPPLPDGNAKGITVSIDVLSRAFFREFDWDPKTGKPSPERLKKLGLTWSSVT